MEGPEILKHSERWMEFTKTTGNKDIIPVFQGSLPIQPQVIQGESDEQTWDLLNFKNISKLCKDTALVKYKNTDSSSLKKAEIFWLQLIQSKHFKNITEFLTKLKGNLLGSISGKKLIRDLKLCPPDIFRDLHLFLDSD